MKPTARYTNAGNRDSNPTSADRGSAVPPSVVSNAAKSSVNAVGCASYGAPAMPPRPGSGGRGTGGFNPELPLPPSARLEVTTANRALLRYLRAAELEAWVGAAKAAEGRAAQEGAALAWSAVAAAGREAQTERWLYAVVAAASLGAAGWGVVNSAGLLNRWPEFVRFIHQLVS